MALEGRGRLGESPGLGPGRRLGEWMCRGGRWNGGGVPWCF